ncbi:DUF6973 domain-containing protein [Variovorax boronicumulans]|uniref:DUF6973 domain-containing protein n=1 Tax=Variovorax boronicumulans TaxID=436515 RepID=UPI0027830367|nr:hypothetical protein [Variovorax boronicumulans]MDQ0042816.1 hypothetical protein [Variovorax boronicumulans]
MSNEATLRLPAGYGFKVSATSDAGAHNFATVGLRRNGILTPLGVIEPGAPSRTVRAVFTDADIVIAGYAGNYRPSLLQSSFKDPGLEIPASAYYDDAYGSDRDFNDLIVTVTRFHAINTSALSSLNVDTNGEADSIQLLTLHPQFVRIEEIIQKIDAGVPIGIQDYSDLPYASTHLNEAEKKLFNDDPITGGRVFIAAKSATSASEDHYQSTSLHNGNGDAFRHMYWNFLMTRSIGEAAAVNWANAHESSPENPPLEKAMDLFNNQFGRKLGVLGIEDDLAGLKNFVRNGECRILKGGAMVKSNRDGEK